MYQAKVEIETIVPYKHDRYTEEAKEAADTGTRPKLTWEQRKKSWEKKIYKDKKGCYMPVEHIYHSLVNGLSGLPSLVSNKVKMTKNTTKATIFIDESKMYLGKKTFDEMDTHSTVCRNAIGNPRVTTGEPLFHPPLRMSFTINVTQDFLTPEVLKEGLARAGQCYGIGRGRPRFGRFIIKKFHTNGIK